MKHLTTKNPLIGQWGTCIMFIQLLLAALSTTFCLPETLFITVTFFPHHQLFLDLKFTNTGRHISSTKSPSC